MEDTASMAHDVLLRAYVDSLDAWDGPSSRELEAEVLRRMDSDARRVDILPDGHRA